MLSQNGAVSVFLYLISEKSTRSLFYFLSKLPFRTTFEMRPSRCFIIDLKSFFFQSFNDFRRTDDNSIIALADFLEFNRIVFLSLSCHPQTFCILFSDWKENKLNLLEKMWPDMARLFLIWQPKFRGRRENICYFILFVLGVSENGFESWA